MPVVALAEQVGLPRLVAEHVRITGAGNSAGAHPAAKVMSLLAGMVAGRTRSPNERRSPKHDRWIRVQVTSITRHQLREPASGE